MELTLTARVKLAVLSHLYYMTRRHQISLVNVKRGLWKKMLKIKAMKRYDQ
jgi:hypothetical protein